MEELVCLLKVGKNRWVVFYSWATEIPEVCLIVLSSAFALRSPSYVFMKKICLICLRAFQTQFVFWSSSNYYTFCHIVSEKLCDEYQLRNICHSVISNSIIQQVSALSSLSIIFSFKFVIFVYISISRKSIIVCLPISSYI